MCCRCQVYKQLIIFFWGTSSTSFHDMPRSLRSSIHSGWSAVVNVTFVWGICGFVSVSRMHMAGCRFTARFTAVINPVIRRCGAAMLSMWAGRVTSGGTGGLAIVLLFLCFWGAVTHCRRRCADNGVQDPVGLTMVTSFFHNHKHNNPQKIRRNQRWNQYQEDPLSLNLPPTTLPYPPPTMATATIHHGYGNGTTHPATHQSTVFSPSMTNPSLQTPHKKTPHPNTTIPRHQRRTLGSAHRHSLRCQGRRN